MQGSLDEWGTRGEGFNTEPRLRDLPQFSGSGPEILVREAAASSIVRDSRSKADVRGRWNGVEIATHCKRTSGSSRLCAGRLTAHWCFPIWKTKLSF